LKSKTVAGICLKKFCLVVLILRGEIDLYSIDTLYCRCIWCP
jgi:hypothetical protein